MLAAMCIALVLSLLAVESLADDAPMLDMSTMVVDQPCDPLPGKLVICGGGVIPQSIYERFVELAGGPNARLVVIPTASQYAESTELQARTKDLWGSFGVKDIQILHTRDRRVANDPEFVQPLKQATGVWIGGGVQQRLAEAYVDTEVEKALHEILNRGCVVGGTSSGAAIMSRLMIREGRIEAKTGRGLGFLPAAVIDQHFLKRNRLQRLMGVLEKNPGLFGLGIDESTAVVVEGRRMTVIGDSQACICFAGSEHRAPRIEKLSHGQQSDLVALSRAAVSRIKPPAVVAGNPLPPQVEGGTLVIVGGGRTPPEAVERFIKSAGGEEAPLVVVTTALGGTPPAEKAALGWLREAGARNVKQIHARTRAEADDPSVLAMLQAAKGVWFTGGRQWRLVDAFANTQAYTLLKNVVTNGGVIGGSSAGATIQGDYLVRGNPLGNEDVMCEGYEQGFRFLPGVAIDQHFSQRNRFEDMLQLKRTYPRLMGLGIDEATAVIVRGREMEVVGANRVAVYDKPVGSADSARPYELLAAGDRYDLVARQRLEAPLADDMPRRPSDSETASARDADEMADEQTMPVFQGR